MRLCASVCVCVYLHHVYVCMCVCVSVFVPCVCVDMCVSVFALHLCDHEEMCGKPANREVERM